MKADFEDFEDVDDLYNTLPLDKVEGLEDLVTIVPPAVVVKEKVMDLSDIGAYFAFHIYIMEIVPASNYQTRLKHKISCN
jgi:hypothetical protein